MTPMFFGERTRKLFGVYQPAAGSASRKRAAVICYPWGPEYTEAHRANRRLARLLSGIGIHTLRFDYYGTGDSGGDTVEGTITGWEADIATAVDELTDMTGLRRVSLIGLRLGALLAARVASRRARLVDSLVLWDPVISGAAYPDELEQIARAGEVEFSLPRPRPDAQGGGFDVLGFPMTALFLAQLRELDLRAVAPGLPKRTLLLSSDEARAVDAAREALAAVPSLTVAQSRAEPCWINHWPVRNALPVGVLQQAVSWFE